MGQLAAIGHRTGVGRIFGRRFSGFIAWWMWRTIYLSKLPGLDKRLRVALDWTLDLVFAKDTVQYTSFRAFSQYTQSSPFHDPEQSPRDSEPDDPLHTLGLVEADPQFEKPIENFSQSL